MNRKVIAVIGLRSGSKGIRDKNIKLINGKPMFGWVVEAALRSKNVDKIIISSDSSQYLELVNRHYPSVFTDLRPLKLAQDDEPEFNFISELVNRLFIQKELSSEDLVVRLHATSPLQTTQDIDCCIDLLLKSNNITSVVAVKKAYQAEKMLHINNNESLGSQLVSIVDGTSESVTPKNRQEFKPTYIRSNIIATRVAIIRSGTLTGNLSKPYVVKGIRIDIDNPEDFYIASLVLSDIENN
tara:strand:+ start:15 stop:737 length:723 start_codon:yes stop_codon:yes gene_type:complete